MRPTRRVSRELGARGQATVELALSLLVFVTVLAFGIHFAEVGYLSLKVHEASAYAIWDATGRRVTSYSDSVTDDGKFEAVKDLVSAEATARYKDFDGLAGTGATVTQVFTKGSGLAVTCERNAAVDWTKDARTARVYPDVSKTLRCRATAKIGTANMPTEFAQDEAGAFFKAKQIVHEDALTICSMGRAYGPAAEPCAGGMSVMLGDWGLAGPAESGSCMWGSAGACTNTIYRAAVGKMWGGAGGASDAFAAKWSPGGTSSGTFWFAYSGEENGYLQPVEQHIGGQSYYTGGVEGTKRPAGCWLGHGC